MDGEMMQRSGIIKVQGNGIPCWGWLNEKEKGSTEDHTQAREEEKDSKGILKEKAKEDSTRVGIQDTKDSKGIQKGMEKEEKVLLFSPENVTRVGK